MASACLLFRPCVLIKSLYGTHTHTRTHTYMYIYTRRTFDGFDLFECQTYERMINYYIGIN